MSKLKKSLSDCRLANKISKCFEHTFSTTSKFTYENHRLRLKYFATSFTISKNPIGNVILELVNDEKNLFLQLIRLVAES